MTKEITQETAQTDLVGRLFEAGAHFGFSKSRRHPSVSPYLFGNKQGSDIIDLEKTSALIVGAAEYLKEIGSKRKKILFVGTKEEISSIVHSAANSLDAMYVTNRWIGGTLTNFSEIKKRIDRLVSLKDQRESGELDKKYTKKERLMVTREIDKLEFNFGGIVGMESLPEALVVVDPRHESIAVEEACQKEIPIVAIMSSDCNVNAITKPIVVNDAHRSSVTLVIEELAQAYREGFALYTPKSVHTENASKDTVAEQGS